MVEAMAQNGHLHKSPDCCAKTTCLRCLGVLSVGITWQKKLMIDSLAPPIAPAPVLENLIFDYQRRKGLWKIMFTNLFMGIITLTVWHFWGKTNVRRHIWSCIHINQEPLEYTGTGGELFRGFVMVLVIFILPFLLLSGGFALYYGPDHPAIGALNGMFALAGYLLGGFALYKARNFQLSRTNWRGIHGNMAGSAGLYSLTYFGNILARSFSLGWATPVMNVVMSEQMIGDMRFGDAAFKFKGRAGPLYPTYALCWFLTLFVVVGGGILLAVELAQWAGAGWEDAWKHVFTAEKDGAKPTTSEFELVGFALLGLMGLIMAYVLVIPALWAIYSAKEMRTLAGYTRFDGAQFKLNAGAWNVIGLAVGNLLIIVLAMVLASAVVGGGIWAFTHFELQNSVVAAIGLGVLILLAYQAVWALTRPLIIQRNIAFIFKRLTMEGAVDLNRIRQSVAAKPKRGEGLADAFDLGAW
jgi:uncharacterized membrane protein YjgN (DUF898 family)